MSIENGETELSSGRLSCQDQSAGCVTQSSTEVVDRASSMDPSNQTSTEDVKTRSSLATGMGAMQVGQGQMEPPVETETQDV